MDQAVLQVAVEDLEQKRIQLGEQQLKIEKAILALQEICEHEFEPSSRDSHYSYEKCKYCGIEQKA
jgi:hypothetical protein